MSLEIDTLWARMSIWYRIVSVAVGEGDLSPSTVVVYKVICPVSSKLRACSDTYWIKNFRPIGRLGKAQFDLDSFAKQIAEQLQK